MYKIIQLYFVFALEEDKCITVCARNWLMLPNKRKDSPVTGLDLKGTGYFFETLSVGYASKKRLRWHF